MAFKYRADQVGSFLRPQQLLDAREDPAVNPALLKDLEDQHILKLLARQKDLGLEIFTDGEFRRSSFMGDFYDSVEGLDTGGTVERKWKKGEGVTVRVGCQRYLSSELSANRSGRRSALRRTNWIF